MSFSETPPNREKQPHSKESLSETFAHVELEILRIVNSLSLKVEQGIDAIAATRVIAAEDLPLLAAEVSNLILHPLEERPLDVPASYVEFRMEGGGSRRLAVVIVEEEFALHVFDNDLFEEYQTVFG